jgi:hypothetical protein
MGNAVPLPGTGSLHYDIGAGWHSAPMEIISPNVYDAVFPAAVCGDEVEYYFSAQAAGGLIYTSPLTAPASSHSATAAYGAHVVLENDLSQDPGWTTEGQWAFGSPNGGGGMSGAPDPTGGYSGSNVYGYNLYGDYTDNMPPMHLTSTAIDCTGIHGASLKFQRWLGVEHSTGDHVSVHVSSDGANWTRVWANAREYSDYDWVEMVVDISAVADDQPSVYLRWTMGPTNNFLTYCGWNIDDIKIVSLNCGPPAGSGDFDGDGDVDLADFARFQSCFDQVFMDPWCQPGDLDPTSSIDLNDYALFELMLGGPH